MCGIRGMCLGMAAIPTFMGILMASAVIVTYVIAVLEGDEGPFLPYISDAGVNIPESCIFSQLFNMAAFLAILTMYLRYKLVRAITQDSNLWINRLVKFNMALACLNCLGLTFVANFQETKIEPMHLTGALMVFGLGVVYEFIDVSISYVMHPIYNNVRICRIRLTIAIWGLLSLILGLAAGAISRKQWEQADFDGHEAHSRQHWKPGEPGYLAHIFSACGEWSLALSFLSYFFTFIRDFQKFTLQVTANMSVTHLDQQPLFIQDENTPLVAT